MEELLILSPCFYPDPDPARLMVGSAHENGLEVHLYGIGIDFVPHGADAQVLRLYQEMTGPQLADYVLVTDCRDVLFLSDAAEIMLKYHSYNSPIVMSAENGCWPPDDDVMKFFYGKDPNGYNYVNAGQYIGDWTSVRLALWLLLDKYRDGKGLDNSQGWWAQAKMKQQIDFVLDSDCKIFQTMSGGCDNHVHRFGRRVLNTVTGEEPCSVHFNGNPNTKDPHAKLYAEVFG